MAYKYIRIVHEGQDYTGIKYQDKYYEVSGIARYIIRALLKKIKKIERK